MATRKRSRTGDQLSKLSDKLAGLAGKKCIASCIRDEHGDVFFDGGRLPRVPRSQGPAP